MNDRSLTTLDFHGATLIVQRGVTPDMTLVAMKPLAEGMGLDWSAQLKKLKEHPVLAEGMAVIATPSDGGWQQMAALALPKLNFWLATIDTGRLRDKAVKERVLAYQRECADVLFRHFFGHRPEAQAVEVIADRPWRERPLEERNTELRTAASIGRYGNHALAWWYLETQARVAVFPRHLLPAWRQAEFAMPETIPAPRGALTITVPLNGEAH